MQSREHRANLLFGGLRDLGVGAVAPLTPPDRGAEDYGSGLRTWTEVPGKYKADACVHGDQARFGRLR